jgi:hypothetical protein
MNLAEQISHHAQALPSPMQQELWAFVQFLEFRLQQQTLDAANTTNTAFDIYERLDLGEGGYSEYPSSAAKTGVKALLQAKHAREQK